MTYRERRIAKAERLRDWSAIREQKSNAARAGVDQIAGMIPFGQPILVGHHSEKRARRDQQRIVDGMIATIEHGRKAEQMASRADEIERQAAGAIYSDDPDAIERLTAKIAQLEAQRENMKARNAAYRAEHKAELKTMSAYERSQAVPFPSYATTNLTGNIGRQKKRLEALKREAVTGPRDRHIEARRSGECAQCGAPIERGQMIRYNRTAGARCAECKEEG